MLPNQKPLSGATFSYPSLENKQEIISTSGFESFLSVFRKIRTEPEHKLFIRLVIGMLY